MNPWAESLDPMSSCHLDIAPGPPPSPPTLLAAEVRRCPGAQVPSSLGSRLTPAFHTAKRSPAPPDCPPRETGSFSNFTHPALRGWPWQHLTRLSYVVRTRFATVGSEPIGCSAGRGPRSLCPPAGSPPSGVAAQTDGQVPVDASTTSAPLSASQSKPTSNTVPAYLFTPQLSSSIPNSAHSGA